MTVRARVLCENSVHGNMGARAEHGCFIGNSLTARPRLVWRVNGDHVRVAA